jgi:hypothetical protein
MSQGPRPERVTTSDTQKAVLREVFNHYRAECWDSKKRKKELNILLSFTSLNNLSINHLRYQWRKFYCEFIVRRQVGSAYYRASLKLSSTEEVCNIIYDIVSIWLTSFGQGSNVTYNIPDKIYKFMQHCVIMGHAEATRAQSIPRDTLTADDRAALDTLIPFVVNVFSKYGEMWNTFSSMEVEHPSDIISGQPHLVIADMELKILKMQQHWSSEPDDTSPIFDFIQNTKIGEWLQMLSDEELYPTDRPAAPDYIGIATYARPGNREDLKNTMFASLIDATYQVYEQRLILIQLMMSNTEGDEGSIAKLSEEEAAVTSGYTEGLGDELALDDQELSDIIAVSLKSFEHEAEPDLSGKFYISLYLYCAHHITSRSQCRRSISRRSTRRRRGGLSHVTNKSRSTNNC